VSKRTEVATQFITLVHDKQYDQAAALLAESVVMTVPQVGPIQGSGAVAGALRMASESGKGFDRVTWPSPLEREDGTVLLAGKAPGGLLGVVAKLLRKQVAVSVSCAFADDDKIKTVDVVMA
jgi:hypothetical protein